MGIVLESKGSQISICIGYITFGYLRTKIAKIFNQEFGEHYEKIYQNIYSKNEKERWAEIKNEIVQRLSLDLDIVNFLCLCDYSDKCSYRVCKKIYDLIKDEDLSINNLNSDDFKQLLKDCYSHRANLVWE